MMKKIYGLLIIVYIIIATGLILFAPKPKSVVYMAVKEQQYSQLLTKKEERFEVLIYLSENDTFLSLKKAITDARLIDDMSEMEVQIDRIEDLETTTKYNNQAYYVFRYSFDLSSYSVDHLAMDFKNAILQLTYDNGEVIQFELGDIYLLFEPLPEVTDFDFFRLSGLFGEAMDKTVFQGILIGFDRFIADEITIKKITCGINQVSFNLDNAIIFDTITENQTLYETLGQDYPFLDASNLSPFYDFKISPSIIYAIPIHYQDELIDLWRFPLIIEYEKDNELKTFLIDDFIYKTETISLAEETIHVHQYQYRYRD